MDELFSKMLSSETKNSKWKRKTKPSKSSHHTKNLAKESVVIVAGVEKVTRLQL